MCCDPKLEETGYGYHATKCSPLCQNIVWTLVLGWSLAAYWVLCAGLVFCTVVGIPVAIEMFIGTYYICCPFGKKFKTKVRCKLICCDENTPETGLHPATFAIWMVGLSGIYVPAIGIGFAYVIAYLFALCACPAVVEICNAGLGKVLFSESASNKDVWYLGRVEDHDALPDSETRPPPTQVYKTSDQSVDLDFSDTKKRGFGVGLGVPPPITKIIVRKHQAEKGGEMIDCPVSIEALIHEGGALLGINAVSARTVEGEVRIRDIAHLKNNQVLYLLTEEEEALY